MKLTGIILLISFVLILADKNTIKYGFPRLWRKLQVRKLRRQFKKIDLINKLK